MAEVGAYVFDLGGVLVRFDESVLRPVLRDDVDAAGWWRFVLHSPAFRGFELGTVSTEAMAEVAVRELCQIGVSPREFLAALAQWPAQLQPGAVEVVRRARATCRPVVMLSNTNPLHWGLLAPHFEAEFDHLVLSFRSGALKPAPEAFACVEALGFAAPELCFFDDNPGNVEAARARGWQAHRVDGPADIGAVLG